MKKRIYMIIYNKNDKEIFQKIKDEFNNVPAMFYAVNIEELLKQDNYISGAKQKIIIFSTSYEYKALESQLKQSYNITEIVTKNNKMKDVIKEIINNIFLISNIDRKIIKQDVEKIWGGEASK